MTEPATSQQRSPVIVRVGLGALVGFVTVNVFTGGPLLALWIGSRLQQGTQPSMGAIALFVLIFAVTSFLLYRLLVRVSAAFERATGTVATGRRRTSPWLRSMRGERDSYEGITRLEPLERLMIAIVVTAGLAFEIWFFFFSGSPIDNRSGRDSALDLDLASVPALVRNA